jgi:hypothetical protein
VAKNKKVTEEELVSRIKTEITDSLGYGDEISKQRETAMEYYYGLPFGNEVEGRCFNGRTSHRLCKLCVYKR